jgi:hypothetical protein
MGKLDRRYVALSIKHSQDRGLAWWGRSRTEDDEERCYSGYVSDPEEAEVYDLKEFEEAHGLSGTCYLYAPIVPTRDILKRYKSFNTVFMTLDDARKLKEMMQ